MMIESELDILLNDPRWSSTLSFHSQTVGAEATIGTEATNDGVTFTAVSAGLAGESISIQMIDPQSPDSVLTILDVGNEVQVSLATDSESNLITSALDLINAIGAGDHMVTAAALGASDGSGLIAANTVGLSLPFLIEEAQGIFLGLRKDSEQYEGTFPKFRMKSALADPLSRGDIAKKGGDIYVITDIDDDSSGKGIKIITFSSHAIKVNDLSTLL